jgi:hypothetical protein
VSLFFGLDIGTSAVKARYVLQSEATLIFGRCCHAHVLIKALALQRLHCVASHPRTKKYQLHI